MSELNINDLPREILIKVFHFLSVVNMKRATLTCKLWNNLIESACRWSLKLSHGQHGRLQCSFGNDAEQQMNFILTTNRKFETISMGPVRKDDQILKVFQRHGFSVVKLIFYRCDIEIVTLAELLHFTPNLKHVIITKINLLGVCDSPLGQNIPDLKKLKNLQVFACDDQRFIECFRKAKLTTIKVVDSRDSDNYGPLVDFLLSQEMVTSLTAESFFSSRSILVEMTKSDVPIPFQLTKLSIIEIAKKPVVDPSSLLKFVKSQAENLTEMELGYSIPRSVYQLVFSMAKLNALSVIIDDVPRDNAFYEQLKENCSVHTITLMDYSLDASENIQYLGKFLKKLPNVRRLNLSRTVNKSPSVMAQSLIKLESLFIGEFISVGGLKFPNLKTLHIQTLWDKINWNKFTKNHSRLTELTIETMENCSLLTSDHVDQMTTNVDLQSIRLGAGFVADDRFFEIIRSKCTKLKVLDLHKSSIPHGLNYNVGIDVLRLCDDIK